MKKHFKYYPEDFGKLTVKVLNMDLDFDVYEDKTVATSQLKARTLETINSLELNAKNLEILEVKCNKSETTFEYKKKEHMLIIHFKTQIEKDTEFVITTKTICRPTNNILEGLYYDETPSKCPKTQITQCQQWGFQRIVPCIDDMTAKCTYTTTISADESYTNLITNGDVSAKIKKLENNRVQIKYDNTITPMATYLFFLGVGTYATFTKEFEYPNGDTFMLELLVPPNSNKEIAQHALQVLNDSIMWIHLFTGPDTYKDIEKKKEILKLTEKRDELKEKEQDLKEIREELKQQIKTFTPGYKYTGTVYREIGMQNSDFGGMENVGNTTITTNRIMPFPEMTDGAFEYMIRVKVHEFYHNLNGSEVTGWSPFEIWLNEAVTVYIEKKYHEFLFGDDYSRLQEVLGLMGDEGTLMQDESVASMPIEPDGFNDPNELITGITYVKAPEYVSMIETLIGNENFVKALDLYHTRYKHSNATRQQWLECMEEVSKMDLKEMSQTWLKTTGFPEVTASAKLSDNTLTINLKQTNDKATWDFPFKVAVFGSNGLIDEKTERINQKEQKIKFNDITKPEFVSLNRGYSFYGKVHYTATNEELFKQVRHDNDIVAKYMAFYYLFDRQKTKLLRDSNVEVDNKLIDLYYEQLSNKKLLQRSGAQILSISESVEDKEYMHSYQKLYEIRKKISKTISKQYEPQLKKMYGEYKNKDVSGTYVQQQVQNIKNRQIKNLCLGLLAKLDTKEIHNLIKEQFNSAKCATDKVVAFSLYVDSCAEDKLEIIQGYEEEASKNLVSWETFLYVIGGNDSDEWLDLIKKIEASKQFRIEQSNDQRALYGGFAHNKKKSLQTEEGRAYLKETIIKLAKVNEYTTTKLLNMFGNVDKMEEEYHIPLIQVLVEIIESLNQEKQPSVYNTATRILAHLPIAVSKYEEEKGKIKLIS
jgi:aminopeptidase N